MVAVFTACSVFTWNKTTGIALEIEQMRNGTAGEDVPCAVREKRIAHAPGGSYIELRVTLTRRGHTTPSWHWARAHLNWGVGMNLRGKFMLASALMDTVEQCFVRYADEYVELVESYTTHELGEKEDVWTALWWVSAIMTVSCSLAAISIFADPIRLYRKYWARDSTHDE